MTMLKKLLPTVLSFLIGALTGFFGRGALPLPAPSDPVAAQAGETTGEKVRVVVDEKLSPAVDSGPVGDAGAADSGKSLAPMGAP
jgi:hypothetical protein